MSNENSYVYELLAGYFRARHFQQIPTDTPQVSMFATFQDTCLYLINLITLDSNYIFDMDRYNHYRETTQKQFENVDSNKTYLLNLLIIEDPKNLSKIFVEKPNSESKFIDIHWLVNSETKELVIPENQPHNILDLETVLSEVIKKGITEFDDWRRTSNHVYVTRTFVAINVLFFSFVTLLSSHIFELPSFLESFYQFLLVEESSGNIGWYMVSIVVHQSVVHLLFTGIAIYILGSRLEQYLSVVQYILIYVISAISGAVICYVGSMLTGVIVPSVGANGAIYGMIASVLILSKATSRPLPAISDLMVWCIFIIGIIYSVLSHDVAAFANIGGFMGGLIITIPIDLYKLKQQG